MPRKKQAYLSQPRGPDHFFGLVSCFTPRQLHGVCERLVKHHRHTRSGFPDLTVWDPAAKRVAFVEVKGPGDRLSNKQVLWLEVLANLGIQAIVCHVEATNGKKIRRNSPVKKSPVKSPAKESPAKSPAAEKKVKKVTRKRKKARKTECSDEDFD